METLESVKRTWAELIGVAGLERYQVVVRPDSPLCPRGWIGILTIADTITASVPRLDLRAEVDAALDGLTPVQAVSPRVVLPRLPAVRAVLGPAALFYPADLAFSEDSAELEEVTLEELAPLLEAASQEDLDESGIAEITGTAFVARAPGGMPVAASGFSLWPNGVAHLHVLTLPTHRRAGHGTVVATAALERAMHTGLLPQWRARPVASQSLAKKLGLIELGAQLSLDVR